MLSPDVITEPRAGITPSAELATFASSLRYEHLPEQAREHARDLLFDAVGNALAGHLGEETPQIAALARALGDAGSSTVIGGEPLSLAGATVLNGFLISATTAMDVYHPAACHVTPEVVPPALGIAERDGIDGKRLLTAVAAGFEVTVRVCLGLNFPAFRARGWHAPGVAGPFGAAAAVGSLIGLDAQRLNAALGLAGSQAAGTYAAWGTPTVKFHQCRAALSGLMAGLLAAQGFRASEEVLTLPDGGIFNAYSDGGRPEAVVKDLGRHWELRNISLRLWTSFATGLITGLLELMRRDQVRAGDVERARVSLDPLAHQMHSVFTVPSGRFDAMLSVPFVTSTVLHDGDAWLEQFAPASYTDARKLEFADRKVEMVADSALARGAVRVELRTRDGRELTTLVEHGRGTPANPVTREELIAKFRRSASGRIPTHRAERALEMLLHLEEVTNCRDLTSQLSR